MTSPSYADGRNLTQTSTANNLSTDRILTNRSTIDLSLRIQSHKPRCHSGVRSATVDGRWLQIVRLPAPSKARSRPVTDERDDGADRHASTACFLRRSVGRLRCFARLPDRFSLFVSSQRALQSLGEVRE